MKRLAGTLISAVLISGCCTISNADRAQPAAAPALPDGSAAPADQTSDGGGETMSIEEQFPDYEPKLTPDTLVDYRPSLSARTLSLPAATPENLADLIEKLEYWRAQAKAAPGGFEQGNIALGADPRQYEASDAELMWAVAGSRVAAVAKSNPGQLQKALPPGSELPLTYPVFAVRHVDVMGSGRFFYVSKPDIRKIDVDAP